MSDVTEMLDRMISGDLALDEVAADFRVRAWPRRTRTDAEDATGLYRLDLGDPDPDPPGAFADVGAYHASRRIDGATYGILAEAVAEALKADTAPTPGTPAATSNEGTT